jgi:outer membrane protein OmpA-like peptidoglycan-associated protein/tetratricopeptide (TPR) repeat protein
MKTLSLTIICVLFLTSFNLGVNSRPFKRSFVEAQYLFLTEEYEAALDTYDKLLRMEPGNRNIQYLIGLCYLNIPGKKQESIPYFEASIQGMTKKYKDGSYREKEAPYEALFYLGRAHHLNFEFMEAIDYYVHYKFEAEGNDFANLEYVDKQIEACELAGEMISRPLQVKFTKMETGDGFIDNALFGVRSADNTIMVCMAKTAEEKAIMMAKYINGTWSRPSTIHTQLGNYPDCQVSSLSHDGYTLLLTRSDPFDSDLYISHFDGNRWSTMEALPRQINTAYYESSASLSGDGQKLYFTSNKKGGYGALDIYVSEIQEDEKWGKPYNVGPKLNTMYNENTPFITVDGELLYFSSQGHTTIGGYDVFLTSRQPDGSWTLPKNLGYPINTPDDDLNYIPEYGGRNAYFASAARGENGESGIYTMEPLELGEPGFLASTDGNTVHSRETTPLESELSEKSETEIHGINAGEFLVIKNIMFEFDQFMLDDGAIQDVDRLCMIMEQFPELSVEVIGHADAMGKEDYNLELSRKRARTVVDYLTGKEIANNRFIAKGVGEQENIAINYNPDGTDNPAGRKLNRHVEVRLMNYEDERITVEEIFVPEHLRPKVDLNYSVLLSTTAERDYNIPKILSQELIHEIQTDRSFIYTTGRYNKKADALNLVNTAVDKGFPGAKLIEKRELDRIIRTESTLHDLSNKIYTIQIIAMSSPLDMDYFIAIHGIKRIIGKDGIYRYVVGEFDTPEQALTALPGIKVIGYPDAFVMNLARYKDLINAGEWQQP